VNTHEENRYQEAQAMDKDGRQFRRPALRRLAAYAGRSAAIDAGRILLLLVIALGAALVPARPTYAADNLLENPGFEQNVSGWELCGSAELVNAGSPGITPAMVYADSWAVRLTYSETASCGYPIFDPYGAAAQLVSIPAEAEDVTISFWYSRVGNPVWDLSVNLAEPGAYGGYIASVATNNLPGWHQFRYELTLDQLERVRGRTVQLKLASSYTASPPSVPDAELPGFYIDDVRVVTVRERMAESPRPADLASDGTAPIVYFDAQLGGIARMEADGSGRRLLYANQPSPRSPAWSSAGNGVAVIEDWLTPEGIVDNTVNRAKISRIKIVDAVSGAAHEIYRTAGLPGNSPPIPLPGSPELPALDVVASAVTWSPDDRQIAVSLCARNRTMAGVTGDPSCWVELIEVATGASRAKLEPGFAAHWSRTNRIIYQNDDAYYDTPQGIYEADATSQPPGEHLLVPGMGAKYAPASFTDREPAWSPDGTQFVTVRNVSGFHYDDAGWYTTHYAIMLFTRGDPLGRQILLVDQGGAPGNLTWAPDGNFVLYTLYQGQGADIWWLDVRTGATGRLTTTGGAAGADWRLSAPASGAVRPWIYLPVVEGPR
jgi:hypothetical protein